MTEEEILAFVKQINEVLQRRKSPCQNRQPIQRHVMFNRDEIMRLPKIIKRHSAHYRKKDGIYQLSYSQKPFNASPIYASGRTLIEAKENFIKQMNLLVNY